MLELPKLGSKDKSRINSGQPPHSTAGLNKGEAACTTLRSVAENWIGVNTCSCIDNDWCNNNGFCIYTINFIVHRFATTLTDEHWLRCLSFYDSS